MWRRPVEVSWLYFARKAFHGDNEDEDEDDDGEGDVLEAKERLIKR